MENKSLLELLQEEHKLCSRLQSVDNMLQGMERTDEEGGSIRHQHSRAYDRLVAERGQLVDELYPIRVRIGSRIGGYTYLFEQDTLEKLRNPKEVAEDA